MTHSAPLSDNWTIPLTGPVHDPDLQQIFQPIADLDLSNFRCNDSDIRKFAISDEELNSYMQQWSANNWSANNWSS